MSFQLLYCRNKKRNWGQSSSDRKYREIPHPNGRSPLENIFHYSSFALFSRKVWKKNFGISIFVPWNYPRDLSISTVTNTNMIITRGMSEKATGPSNIAIQLFTLQRGPWTNGPITPGTMAGVQVRKYDRPVFPGWRANSSKETSRGAKNVNSMKTSLCYLAMISLNVT